MIDTYDVNEQENFMKLVNLCASNTVLRTIIYAIFSIKRGKERISSKFSKKSLIIWCSGLNFW